MITHLSLAGPTLAAFREEQKVQAHYQSFREVFERMSTTEEEVVGAFKARQARDPQLTAARFLRFAEPTPAQRLATKGLVQFQDGAGNPADPKEMQRQLLELGFEQQLVSRIGSMPDVMRGILDWAEALTSDDPTTSNDDAVTMPSAAGSTPQSYREAEVAAVVHHFRENAEVFASMDTSEEEVVGAFRKRQLRQPQLSASEFLRLPKGKRR